MPADQSSGTGIYRLHATIAPGTHPAHVKELIILKTDYPLQPEVRIPFEAIVRSTG